MNGQLQVTATLLPEKQPLVSIQQDTVWAPEPIWTLWSKLEISYLYWESKHHSSIVQSVAYTD